MCVQFTSVALCLALLASTAMAGAIHVPGDHPTIQAAIDAAGPLDTIFVGPGIWHEALAWTDKRVVIEGVHGPKFTIIDGGGAPATIQASWQPGTKLRNLTITGGINGLVLDGAGNESVAQHCVFRGNRQYGCVIQANLIARFSDCEFHGNGFGGARIVMSDGPFLLAFVERCFFALGDGLAFEWDAAVAGASVQACSFDGGSVTSVNGSVAINSCIFRHSTVPVTAPIASVVYSDVEGGWPGDGNIDADPLWVDPAAADLSLLPGSPCIGAADPNLPWPAYSMGADAGFGAKYLDGESLPWANSTSLGIAGMDPGGAISFTLIGFAPSDPFFLVLGSSELGQLFQDGVLWPHPDLILGPFVVDGGYVHFEFLEGTLPSNLRPDAPFWAQVLWLDPVEDEWYMTAGVKIITG